MSALTIVIFLLLGVVGTGVVLTPNPLHQSMVISIYGMLLAVLLIVLQAPDVALSEIVVGAVLFPLMILLALAKTEGRGAE